MNQVDTDLEDLIEQIGRGDVVPIIGNELVKLDIEGKQVPLMDYLLGELEKKYSNRNMAPYSADMVSVTDKINHIHAQVTQHNWAFYSLIGEIMRATEKHMVMNTINKLTSIRKIKMFINATFTNLVDHSLKTTRAGMSNKIDSFSLDISTTPVKDIKIEAATNLVSPATSPRRLQKSVVYNLYGKYEWKSNYIVADDDILELTYALITNKADLKTLFELLTAGSLLFIGCNFPDWLLRFFMRMFSQQRLSVKNNNYTVADILNATDKNRAIFISNSRIKYFSLDGNEFINMLYKKIECDNPTWIRNNPDTNYAFLSYSTEDQAKVRRIYEKLDEQECEAFMDVKSIEYGNDIRDEVKKGIENCRVFIPVISRQTSSIAHEHRYFVKEWRFLLDLHKDKNPTNDPNKGPFIMPVFLDAIPENELVNVVPARFFELKYQGATFDNQLADTFINQVKDILHNKS